MSKKMHPAASRNFRVPPEQQAIRDKCVHPSGTFVEFPIEDVETSIPARFEKMVAQYPDHWAIVSGAESLRYAELNERANGVAHSIIDRRGIGAEPIGILFDTKLALIVAMLGVLKAGKFFVLLDPAWPDARLRVILDDVQAKLLLMEGPTAALTMNLDIDQVLDIGRLGNDVRSDDLQLPISPETLLAISYTTGSTGQPKGVILSHRNLLHQALLFTNTFHHCHRDRISYLTAGTNAAVNHPFYALLIGAAVLPFDVKRPGLEALAAWLRQDKISICAMSAPLFRNLVRNLPGRQDFPDLRLLRLSSEGAYKTDFDLYRKYFPAHCLLGNGVAPSETFLLSVYLMDHGSIIDSHEIPIGYPVQDKEILIIDDSGKEIGANQIGEIVVRSAYLSPGYWQLPELTAAKFSAPACDVAARLYCTGDLALRRPDGCLIHKGRKDFRVKIRGYAVEPAEVEAMMRQHAAVREACVVGRVDEVSGASRLIGYFTQAPGACLAGSDLRTFLNSRLPDYMIPATFVLLADLPLTANGKVNRAALPAPVAIRPELNVPYAAPTNKRESQLSRIWREVLRLEAIGIHDNFFDLGGDSLAAMRIIARIRNWFRAEIPFIEFYKAPTISALAALVQRAPRVKPEEHAASIQPRERAQPIPLSFGQERVWFHEQLEPHAHRFNLIAGFRLHGTLDAVALERAINEIVKRHESLRTVFDCADGKPFQVVLDAVSIGVPVVDIAPEPGETVEQAILRMCGDETQRPFDLARGPLLRATIVRADAQLIALILAIHHLVFDGWSMDVFARELSASYEAALNRQPFQLAPLPIQYADFALWQRGWLQNRDLDAHLSYWRSRLAEISDLQLPADHPRPQFRDSRATRQWFTISPSVARSLKDISGEAGVTLFMTLLAAYQTLLCRYSGQDDICVGVPVAGRQDEALDDAIGLFLNMLVLRTDLSGDPGFRELLGRVRHRCVEAYDHQDIPFERLVEELQPSRLVNQHPLFQASFALRPSGACAIHLRELEVRELEIDPGICRFDLELYLEEKDQGLHGYMAGSADLFDVSSLERLACHFRTLLESIVKDPQQRISALSILTGAERDQLLVKWNDTQADYPKDKCIHELFEEQVERKPDAVAIIFEDRQVTYRELNRRANRLAHYLRKQGVGPESLVAICMGRSIDMVAGLLGILKAGGAYLPLDPGYPVERLKFMLDDARVSVLLTHGNLLEDGASGIKGSGLCSALDPRAQQVYLDRDWQLITRENDANPANTATAENLAYVIYTSGSTGEPKGAAVPHRAVNRLVLNTDYVQLTPSEVMAQSSNVSFDAATFEIWGALLNGARLVLIANDTLLSPQSLSTAIDRHGITTLFLTTALFNQMVEQIPAALGKLRYLLFGGEAADPRWVKELLRNGPPSHLLHVYGPTETTTFATWHRVKAVAADAATVPIGRPIANTEIYILDAGLNPVPIGVVGELYIGGSGVAREYLNRPALTAENFIKHPFTNDARARLYKTGDRARYLPDGNIEYSGRIDNQVKIRGYRIEPGEIETLLAQHAGVREAVVVASDDHVGDKQLVAYVIPEESAPAISDLRAFLKAKLPDYMVPSAFAILESFPLAANGKVDRKALPPPDRDFADMERLYVAPRNTAEQIVAGIWAAILGRKRIGVHDNFFDLGGHSLKATQVAARLRKLFQRDIPLRHLFEFPTIAKLAAVIDSTAIDGLNSMSEVEEGSVQEVQKPVAQKAAARGTD